MKKNFKLVLALVLSIMMILGSIAALADEPTSGTITILGTENGTTYNLYKVFDVTGSGSGTINASNAATDGTASDKQGFKNVAYTIDEDWVNFFIGDSAAGAAYLVAEASASADQKNSLNALVYNGATYYINITTDNIVTFANDAMAFAVNVVEEKTTGNDWDYSVVGNGGDQAVNNAALGYYVIVPVGASEQNANSAGSVASITTTMPNAKVLVKAKKPDVEKVDDTVSADVGQVVTYTVTGTVPNTDGYTQYYYNVTDTMSDGLTLNNDVIVTLKKTGETDVVVYNKNGANNVTSDGVTVAYAGQKYNKAPTTKGGAPVETTVANNSFAVSLGSYLMGSGIQPSKIGWTIEIKYTATVNENAIQHTNEKNGVKLEYSNNPTDETSNETEEKKEEVYTAKINIFKYTDEANATYAAKDTYADEVAAAAAGYIKNPAAGNDDTKYWLKTTPLADAKFVLMDSNGKFYKYTTVDNGDDTVTWVEWSTISSTVTAPTSSGSITSAQIDALKSAATAETITSVTTGANGTSNDFKGLKDGTYYMIEIVAPDGYNILTTATSVTIQGKNADAKTVTGTAQTVTAGENLPEYTENTANAGQTVFDEKVDGFASVQNKSGATLPSTGGIGTTIFYIGGSVLVLAAAILLITKRRMSAND